MRNRSFLFQIVSFLLLLGMSGMTYGVLLKETKAREEKKKQVGLLDSIRQSRREKSFTGTCTVQSNMSGTLYSTRLEIDRKGNDRVVHLIDLQGEKKPLRRNKGRSLGNMASLFQPGSLRRTRLLDIDQIVANYNLTRGGEEILAGRKAFSLRMVPRQNDRPSYLLHVDQKNFFPLGFAVLGKSGNQVYEKRFDSIRFFSGSYEGTQKPRRKPRFPWGQISQERISFAENPSFSFPVWLPAALPEGFQQRESVRLNIGPAPMKVEVVYSLYSDGIALFSLVQFSGENPLWKIMKSYFPGTSSGKGIMTQKISMGIGSVFILEMDGTVIILAGNIWSDTLQKTAESLKPYMGDPS